MCQAVDSCFNVHFHTYRVSSASSAAFIQALGRLPAVATAGRLRAVGFKGRRCLSHAYESYRFPLLLRITTRYDALMAFRPHI